MKDDLPSRDDLILDVMSQSWAHGTSACNLDDVLLNGLRPRTDPHGMWPDNPSIEGHVYLTSSYGAYFAVVSADQRDCTDGLIIQVDPHALPEADLYPDEDAVAQVRNWQKRGDGSLRETTESVAANIDDYRSEGYSAHWSMLALGNCSHRGRITPDKIVRVVRLRDMFSSGYNMVCDPTITTMNFYLMGDYYKDMQKWLLTLGEGDMPLLHRGLESKVRDDAYLLVTDRIRQGLVLEYQR